MPGIIEWIIINDAASFVAENRIGSVEGAGVSYDRLAFMGLDGGLYSNHHGVKLLYGRMVQ